MSEENQSSTQRPAKSFTSNTSLSDLPQKFRQSHTSLLAADSMNTWEQKVFGLLLQSLSKESDDAPLREHGFIFKTNVIAEAFGVSSKHVYQYLKPACNKLVNRSFALYDDKQQSFKVISLFIEAKYEHGQLTLYPHYDYLSELRNYSKGYALVVSNTFNLLKDEYALKTYKLLSRFKDPNKRFFNSFKIADLQKIYGVVDHEGKPFPNKKSLLKASVFVERVLVKSIKYLASHEVASKELSFDIGSGGRLGVEIEKSGNRFDSIKFLYSWDNEVIKHLNNSADHDELRAFIKETELKRQEHGNTSLSDEELQFLHQAYITLGYDDYGARIKSLLEQRKVPAVVEPMSAEEDFDSFLQDIHSQ